MKSLTDDRYIELNKRIILVGNIVKERIKFLSEDDLEGLAKRAYCIITKCENQITKWVHINIFNA